jgi:hypothetical protein
MSREEVLPVRFFKSKEEKEQIGAAHSEYDDFVRRAETGEPEEVRALAVKFKASPAHTSLSDQERRKCGGSAFRAYADNVLADDHLTIDEEMAFKEVADALDVNQEAFESSFRDLPLRMAVARANDGRLSIIEQAKIMTKKNEVVHLEVPAALMKEVAVREWQAGSSGMSFRIAKGVSYRVGQTRGKSVVVGTELQVEDSGVLSVTSQRVVYMGNRKTIDVPFAKMVNIDVFTDGIRVHASNRQRPPLFKFAENMMGDAVAATLNAAVQRFNE